MKFGIKWLYHQRHPNPQLQIAWNSVQLAVLILPFSSLLGGLGILFAAVGVGRRHFHKIAHRPLNRGFAVLALLMLLSTALAFKRIDAFWGLFNFLPFFFVFAALSELIQTTAQLRRLAWILVSASVPVVAIGFGQRFFGLTGEVELLSVILDWVIDPLGNPTGRMSSIFSYANVFASYLVVTLILSLGLWIEAISRYQASATRHQKAKTPFPTPRSLLPTLHSLLPTLFLSLAVLGNGTALILTDSRNAWAIAIIACLAFAIYLGWRGLLAGISAIAATILGAAFAPAPLREWLRAIVPAFFWARLTDQLYPDRPIAQLRSTQWNFAWSLIKQHPFTGWGLRNFSPIYKAQMHYFIGHPHNLFLMLAAETGLFAAVLFFSLVGSVVLQGTLLLAAWSQADLDQPSIGLDQLIFFTYLTAFMGCCLFSLLDITLFDVRINLLGWLLLSAVCGVTYRSPLND